MTAALYNAQWYRVARLKPRLRAQVRVVVQQWRGQRWYLLSDAATGRQHRIDTSAYEFVGRCDGQRSVHEVWTTLLQAQPDRAPTQDEVLRLLGQLNELELLQSEQAPPVEALLHRRDERQRQRRRAMLNPFSFRLPLGDPSAGLQRLDPLGRLLFQPAAFWLWLVSMLMAGLVAASEWPALKSHAALHLLGTQTLATAWVCYPLMKALHELGHALAVRRWGGQVHEVGIGLMLLVPAPYVDASAASAFTSRAQRALVGAAGVMVELALAALGLLVWLATQPGLVHHTAFTVMFIGVASTLLFNGNPLLRFDAYHVMCDLFELPNLGARSNALWSHHLGRVLLGSRTALPPHAASEAKWLWAYAPLSLAYRLVVSASMVLWLGGQWLVLGAVTAAYVIVSVLLQPLVGWARQALASVAPGGGLAGVRVRLVGVLVAVATALCVVPVPVTTVAPAVVWLPERAQLRPEVDGFIARLPVADGAPVQPGELIAQLANPELLAAREQLASRLEGLQAEHYQALLRDPNAAQNLALDIDRTQSEVQRADERIARLQLRAQAAGTLVMPRQGDLLGAYLRQGSLLGHVLAPGELRVRAAVPEAEADLVRRQLQHAEVRLADAPGAVLKAHLVSQAPAATRELPSLALSLQGGGPYAVDPAQKDGLHSLEPVFLVDLSLAGHTLERVGGRAWVRFVHDDAPLAQQWLRRAAQLFLKQVSVSG